MIWNVVSTIENNRQIIQDGWIDMNSLVRKSFRDLGFIIQWEGDVDEDTLTG